MEYLRSGSVMVWLTSVKVVGMAVGMSARSRWRWSAPARSVLLDVVSGAVMASTAATVPLGDGSQRHCPKRNQPGG